MEVPRLVKTTISAVATAGGRKVTVSVAVEVINEDVVGEVALIVMTDLPIRLIFS